MAAKVGRPPRPSPGQQYSQLSHFLANPEQQSVTEVIDLKFVGGLCGRDRYTAGYWQPAVQSGSWELCSYPETSLMFIMFCSASSPEQLKAARHIIHCRHCGYFLLDVKQYPSHRTSSIPSWTHLHIFCTECVIFAVCCCEGRVVAQWPSAAPDLLTQLSTAEARSHGHSSQLSLSASLWKSSRSCIVPS